MRSVAQWRHVLSRPRPQVASQAIRRAGRPGTRGPRAHQCAGQRPRSPCLPVHGYARRGQDHHRPHLRQIAELREGHQCRSLRPVRGLPGHRCRPLYRSAGDRRCLEHRCGRCARSDRERAVHALARQVQGLSDRRSAHAVESGVQRAAEDAGGAAGTRQVPARHHRPAEAAGHRAVALPAVQPQAPGRGTDPRADDEDPGCGSHRGRCDRHRPARARRRRLAARRPVAARPGHRLRRWCAARGRRAHHAGHGGPYPGQRHAGGPGAGRWRGPAAGGGAAGGVLARLGRRPRCGGGSAASHPGAPAGAVGQRGSGGR